LVHVIYRKLFKKRVKRFKTGKWEEIWQEQKKVKVGIERVRGKTLRSIRIVVPIVHMSFRKWNQHFRRAFSRHIALLPDEYREPIGEPNVFTVVDSNSYDRPIRMSTLSINSALSKINIDLYKQNKDEFVRQNK